MMASGGTETRDLPAADYIKDVGIKTKTSPEEVWPNPHSAKIYKLRVWKDLRNLFQEDELTDVMLAAEGQSIPCHRVLLAAASKFFHGKFVVHPESVEHNLLDVEDIDFDTLTSIVSYIYTGQVALTVEKTNKLIPASVSLMLPELTKVCRDFLIDKANHDMTACIDIHRIARANSLADLADKTWQVMLEKFQEVSQSDAFKKMTETELQEYIKDEGLNVASEDPVFEAVMTWIRHDVENRKSRFENLIENVKLSHCTPHFLGEIARKEPLMRTLTNATLISCFEHLSDTLKHYAPYHPVQFGTTRRGFSGGNTSTLIAICGAQCWILMDRESAWVSQRPLAKRTAEYSSACVIQNGILITGGCTDKHGTAQCWKVSLPTLECTIVPDLTNGRYDHATACVGNRAYVLGGRISPGNYLKSVEYLDEKSGSWTTTTDMISYLDTHTAVSRKGFIYVFGAVKFDYRYYSKATIALDTTSQTWSRKSDMPGYCGKGSSVIYMNKIYILGGQQNCCMSYDPDQDQWQTHSKPRMTHEPASAVVWKDRILLCGGTKTSVIEEYNPDTDTWSEWKHQLPQAAEVPCALFTIQM